MTERKLVLRVIDPTLDRKLDCIDEIEYSLFENGPARVAVIQLGLLPANRAAVNRAAQKLLDMKMAGYVLAIQNWQKFELYEEVRQPEQLELERLRAALEWYAADSTHDHDAYEMNGPIHSDLGMRARAALVGLEPYDIPRDTAHGEPIREEWRKRRERETAIRDAWSAREAKKTGVASG
jgi:hypothetical protein